MTSNLKHHGVSFDEAALVFQDNGRLETYDGREGCGEDRWVTIELAWSALLYVVHTVRDDENIRTISARRTNGKERKKYYKANH